MTQTAKLYGGSLYDLAAEEQLADVILEQMREVQELFWKNPEYVSLLLESAILFLISLSSVNLITIPHSAILPNSPKAKPSINKCYLNNIQFLFFCKELQIKIIISLL